MCEVHRESGARLNARTPSVKRFSGSVMLWGAFIHFAVVLWLHSSAQRDVSHQINTKFLSDEISYPNWLSLSQDGSAPHLQGSRAHWMVDEDENGPT